jgi:hypothetical protein
MARDSSRAGPQPTQAQFFAKVIKMKMLRMFSAAGILLLSAAAPAVAATTVSSPLDGATVSTPFTLSVSADTCSGRPVAFIGYSFDDSTHTPIWRDHQINGPVGPAPGLHKLHVKVWNDQGAVCVTDVSVNVGGAAAPPAVNSDALSRVPSNAAGVSAMQSLGNWIHVNDSATSGSSTGWTGTQSSPSLSGSSREFATTLQSYGGHRYSVQFGDDKNAHSFLLDTYVYIAGSNSDIANLEFDLNQTMQSGHTAIMGFQCDGWTGTWDYTVNGGSPTNWNDVWLHSNQKCNPQSWAPNQWHHLQIHFTHEDSGWVTYQSVWLDGVQQDLYIRAFSGFALGWGPSLVANFQVDGANGDTSSSIVYLDKMTVYRW